MSQPRCATTQTIIQQAYSHYQHYKKMKPMLGLDKHIEWVHSTKAIHVSMDTQSGN